jgi:Glycosyl hydrolases family 2, sugar binding domain/Glycosyl hydrolases family 2, TIM barrel domain/Glycosyl hydrolases family 2
MPLRNIFFCICLVLIQTSVFSQKNIPLPEHPRPDFERSQWLNLNGDWDFEFDKNDIGIAEKWFSGQKKFTKSISVPFPWGSPLSSVKDEADIAWYSKDILIPQNWQGKRVFLTIGASDWKTTVWLDGQEIGSHDGGYTPFSFEIPNDKSKHKILIRVDDVRRDFTLYGKQGYGNARGIWQTIYLEARGNTYVESIHFTPDIDNNQVKVVVSLDKIVNEDTPIKFEIRGINKLITNDVIKKGEQKGSFVVSIASARLWTLQDPFLYEVSTQISNDIVDSYFGMRKISTMNLPNTNFKYIALNNKPIYLQLALDQSYHPTGFYTFPTDEFMKNEILLSKKIGLNGIRTHIKVDIPRKLYWADKLGLLVMSDLPNSWGEPDAAAQKESEYTLREMIKRDFNHPSIFSWITFNETWGLRTKSKIEGDKSNKYLPETQKWVASVYRLAKSLDPTRLVEDNSICCGAGHTETDINSWHEYLPGAGWEKHLNEINEKTFVGSEFHYEKGYTQTDVPNINSECGNVWGYSGSTGDVDWSWDYHRMMNTFRKYPKIAGWLYTEHHDVINEWNGYFRFDRTEKETGVGDLVPGMSIKDFHSDVYISAGNEISKTTKVGERVTVPLFISSMTDKVLGDSLTLYTNMYWFDAIGQRKEKKISVRKIAYTPWMQAELEPIQVTMPNEKSLAVVSLVLEDRNGDNVHRNFTTFSVEGPETADIKLNNGKIAKVITFEPKDFTSQKWSKKQWNVFEGAKINGAGAGYFEYTIKIPKNVKLDKLKSLSFIAELSAKQLFVKDMDMKLAGNEDYMLGAKAEPSQNKNAYPMTDTSRFPSTVIASFNGENAAKVILENDPADHRGILSWHYQKQDKTLTEAGSYGYKTQIVVPKGAIEKAKKTGEIFIRLSVPESSGGGLAIFGDKFGRFPIKPSLVFEYK